MIKNKPPFPFHTIAVAVAFSPRMENILIESFRLAGMFDAKLLIINIDENPATSKEKIKSSVQAISKENVSYDLICESGITVEKILEICEINVVDLLVIGALEREGLLTKYIGSVSRDLCRRAKCSILLLTVPQANGTEFNHHVVNGSDHPKTLHSIRTAAYFAGKVKPSEFTVIREIDVPAMAMSMSENISQSESEKIKKDIRDDEFSRLNAMVSELQMENVQLSVKSITGKPGFAISNFAKQVKADLLVVNSSDKDLNIFDRLFPHDVEYILEELPCNLLIVHSRI
jgi:nucleotide-binding universal stress UspA family protein